MQDRRRWNRAVCINVVPELWYIAFVQSESGLVSHFLLQKLWDETRRVTLLRFLFLLCDYLCGRQGIVSGRLNCTLLQMYLLRLRLGYCIVHSFSFSMKK